ncbi:MAG: PAS domain S-box protein [Chloroflexi bacterium]|nr:PAS domain S-box protein [Chloroflexota bacterium]
MAITEIQALHRVVQALAHIDDVHGLLQCAVDSLAEVLSADEVIFTGLDQDTQQVTQFARGGPCANTVGAVMVRYEALVVGAFERAIREMKPIFSTETALLPWADNTSRVDRLESVARPMIIAPAIGHGRLLGLLTAVGRFEALEAEPDFGPDDSNLMATMASMCELAIEKERASEKAMIAAGREFPFFEKLDQINRTISKTADLDTMLRDVLDALLSVFECDRAWMAYPCEPDSPTWSVPMERTRPEYPGVLPLGIKMPLEPVGAAIYRILREAEGPVQFGPGGAHPMPDLVAQRFGVQSFIAMALYPKVDRPWAFGLHQCSNARIWSRDEERLFLEIGRRLSDGLTSLLTYRNLQKSQGELLQSNTLLWTIIEAAPTAIVALDLDGVVRTVWNTAAEKMLGWTAEEAIGQQLPSVPPSQWPQFQGFLASLRRGEGLNGVEVRRQKREGSPIDYSIYASPLRDSAGQINGNVAVLVDVTERKRAEAALRLYNERLLILREIDRAILGAQSTEKSHALCWNMWFA